MGPIVLPAFAAAPFPTQPPNASPASRHGSTPTACESSTVARRSRRPPDHARPPRRSRLSAPQSLTPHSATKRKLLRPDRGHDSNRPSRHVRTLCPGRQGPRQSCPRPAVGGRRTSPPNTPALSGQLAHRPRSIRSRPDPPRSESTYRARAGTPAGCKHEPPPDLPPDGRRLRTTELTRSAPEQVPARTRRQVKAPGAGRVSQIATSASLHLVDLAHPRGRRRRRPAISREQGRASLRLALLRALLRGQVREDADVIRRPKLPRFSPVPCICC